MYANQLVKVIKDGKVVQEIYAWNINVFADKTTVCEDLNMDGMSSYAEEGPLHDFPHGEQQLNITTDF